jgi:hypothetical protein
VLGIIVLLARLLEICFLGEALEDAVEMGEKKGGEARGQEGVEYVNGGECAVLWQEKKQ